MGALSVIEPFRLFEMPADEGHAVYAEECGNPDGIPVLFVHAESGGGCEALHEAWPEAGFEWVPDATHSALEPGITAALVDATDRLRKLLA